MMIEDAEQQSPSDYLNEEELCIEARLLSCPFCGKPPQLRARENIQQESKSAPSKIVRTQYVFCCDATYPLPVWQAMACQRVGWT